MVGKLKHILRDEFGGAGLVYGLVGAILTFGVVVGLQTLGVSIDGMVETVDGWIQAGLQALGLNA